MKVEFGLAFNLVRCETCGSARPAEAPCPQCGSRIMYADPELDRRRAVIQRLRPILDSPGALHTFTPDQVFGAVGPWSDAFLQAAQALGTKADAASEHRLALELERFRDVVSGVAASSRDPTLAAAWATIDAALAALRGAVDAYLDALEAQSPESAARFGAQGQRGIDAAAAAAHSFNLASAQARRGGGFFHRLFGSG